MEERHDIQLSDRERTNCGRLAAVVRNHQRFTILECGVEAQRLCKKHAAIKFTSSRNSWRNQGISTDLRTLYTLHICQLGCQIRGGHPDARGQDHGEI